MCVMINVLIFNTAWLRELSVIDCSHYYQHHYDQDLIHTSETTDWGLRTREFFSFFLFSFFFFSSFFFSKIVFLDLLLLGNKNCIKNKTDRNHCYISYMASIILYCIEKGRAFFCEIYDRRPSTPRPTIRWSFLRMKNGFFMENQIEWTVDTFVQCWNLLVSYSLQYHIMKLFNFLI